MANRIAGITVEINGDSTKLTKALKDVNKAVSSSQSALKDVNKLLKLDPGNVELLTQKQKNLTSAIDGTKERLAQMKAVSKDSMSEEQWDALQREIIDTEQKLKKLEDEYKSFGSVGAQQVAAVGEKMKDVGGKMESIGTGMSKYVTAPIVGIGGVSIKFASDFETAMAKVSTIADTTAVPLENLEADILELSNETGIAATDIADSVYSAISAGQSTGDAVNFVSNATKLAKAGFAETSDSLNVLTTIMNAYGLGADKVASVSDKLITTQNLGKTSVAELASSMGKVIPTANMYGVNLDNISAAYVTTTKNGIATAESTTYINGMLNELGKSGSTASKILQEKTGKSFKDLMDSGMSLTDVLSIVREGADESGKSIGDMFSSQEAGKAAATLIQHAEDFDAAIVSMGNSAGATQAAYDQMDATKAAEAQKILNELKNTSIGLGSTILETFGPMIQSAAEKTKAACEWFNGLNDSTKETIVKIAGVAAAIGPLLVAGGKVTQGVGRILTYSPQIVSTIGKIGGAITGGGGLIGSIGGLITKLGPLMIPGGLIVAGIAAGAALIIKNWDKIKETAGKVKDFVSEKWSALKTKVSETTDAIKTKVSEGWDGLKTKTSEAWGAIKDKVQENGGGIRGVLATAVQGYASVWRTGFDALNTITGGRLGNMLTAVHNTMESIKTKLRNAVAWFKSIFNFSWSLPKIKLPHFSIQGGFSLNPPSLPHFSVQWYRKAYDNPVLFSRPTVLPTAAGAKGFGDGPGSEVVLGLNNLRQLVGGGGVTNNITIVQQPGQSQEELARYVVRYIDRDFANKEAVWG